MERNYVYAIAMVAIIIVGAVGAYWWFSSQPAPLMNIVDNLQDSTSFTTLVTALESAELNSTLQGSGPFTVFAPRNVAFDALPAGVLDDLLANTTELTEVLTYHVVTGKYMAVDLSTLSTLTTLQGDDLTITMTDSTVTVNGNSLEYEIEASNGVIHVIGTVLIP